MRQKLVILGTRIFAEEVAELVDDGDDYEVVAFAENHDRTRAGGMLLGRPVVWLTELAPLAATHHAVCALSTTRRAEFLGQAEAMGFTFATIRHPTAHVARSAVVGAGSIVGAGVVIGAQTRLGRHVIVNRGALIGHHTTIADIVTIQPGANIAGCVQIGSGTYVGIGAVVLDRITIGQGAIIGAGAIVMHDVADRTQVVALPARVFRKDIEGR